MLPLHFRLDKLRRGQNMARMARPIRIEQAGGWYHVTARGNERRPIYRDNRDGRHFCALLGETVSRFQVRLPAPEEVRPIRFLDLNQFQDVRWAFEGGWNPWAAAAKPIEKQVSS